MTPFRIRQRIKKLLGLDAPPKPPKAPASPRYSVRFQLPDGTSYEASGKAGDPLARVSGRGPRPLLTGCPDSTCGTCAVEILAGHDHISSESEREVATRRANGVADGLRLACSTSVMGEGVEVRVLRVLGDDFGE